MKPEDPNLEPPSLDLGGLPKPNPTGFPMLPPLGLPKPANPDEEVLLLEVVPKLNPLLAGALSDLGGVLVPNALVPPKRLLTDEEDSLSLSLPKLKAPPLKADDVFLSEAVDPNEKAEAGFSDLSEVDADVDGKENGEPEDLDFSSDLNVSKAPGAPEVGLNDAVLGVKEKGSVDGAEEVEVALGNENPDSLSEEEGGGAVGNENPDVLPEDPAVSSLGVNPPLGVVDMAGAEGGKLKPLKLLGGAGIAGGGSDGFEELEVLRGRASPFSKVFLLFSNSDWISTRRDLYLSSKIATSMKGSSSTALVMALRKDTFRPRKDV